MTWKAVIFDMDGVLVDTLPIHNTKESEVLKEEGVEIAPWDIVKRFNGFNDYEMFDALLKENGLTPKGLELSERKWKRVYEDEDLASKIKLIEGSKELVYKFSEMSLPLAIASGSPRHFIRKVVETIDLNGYFEALCSGQEVAKGKPAPDVYLETAKRLQVKPEETLVIEDSPMAMQGAKEAGCKVVGLVENSEKEVAADLKVTSLLELDIDSINDLFQE
jgi:HAD superfamily hydrolase (TIGR01509 family)